MAASSFTIFNQDEPVHTSSPLFLSSSHQFSSIFLLSSSLSSGFPIFLSHVASWEPTTSLVQVSRWCQLYGPPTRDLYKGFSTSWSQWCSWCLHVMLYLRDLGGCFAAWLPFSRHRHAKHLSCGNSACWSHWNSLFVCLALCLRDIGTVLLFDDWLSGLSCHMPI